MTSNLRKFIEVHISLVFFCPLNLIKHFRNLWNMGHVTRLVFHLVPTNFPSHDDYLRLSFLSFLKLGDIRY